MEKVDKKKLLLYVLTQLKNGKYYRYWDDQIISCDSPTLKSFVSENEILVKKYINFLIGIKTSDFFNTNIDGDSFIQLCRNSKLETVISEYVEDVYGVDIEECDDETDSFSTYTSNGITDMLLNSIFEYVNEFYKLSEMEIQSFILFGKNLFYDIQTQP